MNLSFDFGDSGLVFGPPLKIKGMKDHPQGISLDGLEFHLFFLGYPEADHGVTVVVV